jgi:hypothetical protein
MHSAAEEANIQEPGCARAIETIHYWGKVIKEDFTTRNVDSPDPDFANYREMLDFQRRFNQVMANRVAHAEATTEAGNHKLGAVLANQQQILANQQQIFASLAQFHPRLLALCRTKRNSIRRSVQQNATLSDAVSNKKRPPDDNGISDVQRLVKHTKGTDLTSNGETKPFPVSPFRASRKNLKRLSISAVAKMEEP